MLGPTAAGKTEVAVQTAERIGAEVISVDSMQVYVGMDIGTAKPNMLERDGVPHHMIDIAEPEANFSVADFRRLGREVLGSSDSARMLITGGSGLHFRALVDPMSFAPTDPEIRAELEEAPIEQVLAELRRADPEAERYVDMANSRRVIRAVEIWRLSGEGPSQRATSAEAEDLRRYVPEIEFTAVGVDPGELLEQRVEARLARMRAGGLVDEVGRLRRRLGRTARNAVGYREILGALDGFCSVDEAFERAARNTRKLARKQRTWFQRDPRIRWIPWFDDVADRVDRVLEAMS
ncbi:MAG TPA: tRNA (adenosine(37)-N6)-dimethylallyltransferase MiaA [Acidimicrobiia bacterium]|nr:tRNA (adenosine(37)-N6)-dimethylallyltransferase MiaA [Acidimicrobiia bacterium]